MLALSASDLADPVDDRGLITTAISHRVRAIEALSKAVTEGITCWEKGNAMLATCFVLVFQSLFLDDGLTEYISFLRGIFAIAMELSQKKMKFVFTKYFPRDQLNMLEPRLASVPLIKNALVSGACTSMEKMSTLCKTQTEIDLHGLLLSTALSLNTSSRECEIFPQFPLAAVFIF